MNFHLIERTRMMNSLTFPAVLPQDGMISRTDARNIMDDLRQEAADFPEMSLEEINAEITAMRKERKNKQ